MINLNIEKPEHATNLKNIEHDGFDIKRTHNTQLSATTRSRASTYSISNIYTIHGGSLAGGMASGNFDADEYSELVVIGGSSEGRTTLIDYDEKLAEFKSDLLWWDPNGALLDVVVGEVDGTNSGPEILLAGYSGNLTQIQYTDPENVKNTTIWKSTPINNQTTKLNHLYGLAIGNVDPRFSGNEIAVVDATTKFVYILARDRDNEPWSETRVKLGDIPRNVYIGDFDTSYPGDELLAICVNGSVYRIGYNSGYWYVLEIFKDTKSPMSAVLADFNTSHAGLEVVVSGQSRNATIIWGSGTSWNNFTIWYAPGALEGMAFGEFNDLHDGPELCIAGYSNSAVMLYETELGWYTETIFYDPNPLQTELNGAVIADFTPVHEGTELMLVGFSGNITMLVFQPPDFILEAPSKDKSVNAGDFVTFQVSLVTFSDYNSSVNISLDGLPDDVTYTFSRDRLSSATNDGQSQSSTVLTIDTTVATKPEAYKVTITGTSTKDFRIKYLNLSLEILPAEKIPDFEIKVIMYDLNLNLSKNEYTTEVELEIESINEFTGFVEVYIEPEFINSETVSKYLSFTISPIMAQPGDIVDIRIDISDELKQTINFTIPLHVKSDELKIERSKDILLTVEYYQSPKNGKNENNGENIEDTQLVALILVVIVVVVMVSFMIWRVRQISKINEKRRELLKEQRTSSESPAFRSGRVGRMDRMDRMGRMTKPKPQGRTRTSIKHGQTYQDKSHKKR